jgi:serine/threonine-protein kinase
LTTDRSADGSSPQLSREDGEATRIEQVEDSAPARVAAVAPVLGREVGPNEFDQLRPGRTLGRYELLLPVGMGGMAQVWAARLRGTRGFQKIVAIKVMLPAMADEPNFQRMFLDEARLASQIRHPHVIEILDLGEDQDVLYLVMDWVDGEPLNVIMRHAAQRGGIPLAVAVNIAIQACRGLHAAHELRNEDGELVELVHRDVTPQNILVSYDGVVKIVDFGVAKATSRQAAETARGHLKGKVAYMSPEQLRSEPIDRRTDIFALGIVLYMMTVGKHPFKSDNEGATILNIISEEPVVPPRQLVKEYPATLESIVLRALDKNPKRRFATANEMLKALSRALPTSVPVSTDEEVAGFLRALLPDRLYRRKAEVRRALDLADARLSLSDIASSPRNPLQSEVSPPSISNVNVDRPEATGAGPSTVETVLDRDASRRRSILPMLIGGLGLLGIAATALLFAGGRAESEGAGLAPTVSPAAPPSSVLHHVQAPEVVPRKEDAGQAVVLTFDAGADALDAQPASSAAARKPIAAKPAPRQEPSAKPSERPKGKTPFVSPVRNPGF